MKLIPRLGVAAAVVTSSVFAGSPAALADEFFSDPVGDAAKNVDITAVRVDNGTSQPRFLKVAVRHADPVAPGQAVSIYYDTNRSDAGPEYLLYGVYASEYNLRRVETWRDFGRDIRCNDTWMKRGSDHHIARTGVLRSCLAGPDRVRVAVKTSGFNGAVDWAPCRRHLLPFVPR